LILSTLLAVKITTF